MVEVLSMDEIQRELIRLEKAFCQAGNSHAFFVSTYIVSMQKCELLVEAINHATHPQHAEYARCYKDAET